jgi:hypothetical protein
MEEYLEKIKSIAFKFRKVEDEEYRLNIELSKVGNEHEKLESSFTIIINKFQKNSIILEELDNVLTILKKTKDEIINYKQFKAHKRKNYILQSVFVVAICGILISPLIVVNIIAFLELIILDTMFIGLSNSLKYFNGIRPRKKLIESNDLNKLNNEVNKRERQKEIAECISIKLDIRKIALTNEIDNLNMEKEYIFHRLEYLEGCKRNLMRELSKEVESISIEKSNQSSKDTLTGSDSCLKLEQR